MAYLAHKCIFEIWNYLFYNFPSTGDRRKTASRHWSFKQTGSRKHIERLVRAALNKLHFSWRKMTPHPNRWWIVAAVWNPPSSSYTASKIDKLTAISNLSGSKVGTRTGSYQYNRSTLDFECEKQSSHDTARRACLERTAEQCHRHTPMRRHLHSPLLEFWYRVGPQRFYPFNFLIPLLGYHRAKNRIGGVGVGNPEVGHFQSEDDDGSRGCSRSDIWW